MAINLCTRVPQLSRAVLSRRQKSYNAETAILGLHAAMKRGESSSEGAVIQITNTRS